MAPVDIKLTKSNRYDGFFKRIFELRACLCGGDGGGDGTVQFGGGLSQVAQALIAVLSTTQ